MTAAQLLENLTIDAGGASAPPPDGPGDFTFSAEPQPNGTVLFTVSAGGATIAFEAKREAAIGIRDVTARAIGSAFTRNLVR